MIQQLYFRTFTVIMAGGYIMKKTIISGVVFMLVISNPLVSNIEVFAYEILKVNFVISERTDEDEAIDDIENNDKEVDAMSVDNLISNLDSNTREINDLLKEKKTIVENVRNMMDLRVVTKAELSENQISQFQEFSSCYQKENQVIKTALRNISANDLIDVKNEMLQTQSDFGFIYDKLSTINSYQFDAIYSLKSIINTGTKTLAAL